MKIKRIQVKNIGPYVNENAFDFDVSDITKRMVLIGGKNGAGKTTLFNAIKICLYGCVAYGFESNNAKYFAEIEKIINANEKLQKIGEAEVVIDLLMDDGKYDHTYTFVRSWRVAGKKIAETFTVYKDGETLSETGKSDFESYDGYLQMKSDLNEQKSKCTQQLLEVDKELQELRAQKAISASKLAKAKSDYEALLKKQSINDISARALLAFDELQKTLYDKSIRLVETGFSQFFASLINKSDLIDGIHIDDSLNVLPYKNKHFKADEIHKIIGKNGVEYLIAQIGLYAYEVLQQKLIVDEAEFELPVEVKQQLSAGEKQIFIMALYQALSQLNKINVPYIVDTPFARIDKEHRGKILSQFFKKLNGQIIILSTDEEIVGDYRESISDIVSNTFVLNHTTNGNTEILANTYFGGKHND